MSANTYNRKLGSTLPRATYTSMNASEAIHSIYIVSILSTFSFISQVGEVQRDHS